MIPSLIYRSHPSKPLSSAGDETEMYVDPAAGQPPPMFKHPSNTTLLTPSAPSMSPNNRLTYDKAGSENYYYDPSDRRSHQYEYIDHNTANEQRSMCHYLHIHTYYMYINLIENLIYYIWRSFERSVKFPDSHSSLCRQTTSFCNLTVIDVLPKMSNLVHWFSLGQALLEKSLSQANTDYEFDTNVLL